MTRGRKKDLTAPPTRALTLQRDYRSRKAQYLADLEARYKVAEEENILASMRLRDSLAAASESFSQFMQTTLPGLHLDAAPVPPSYTSLVGKLSEPDVAQVPPDPIFNAFAAELARPESPCCGGYIICEGLVEEDDEMFSGDCRTVTAAVSQLRSTSS
ncbi:hypothetical protein C8R46DRAFT_1352154 [Mycena filopes]|nr:hypothetical protein C8R46DRAFT_1352154 [Mycena filopes]